MPQQKALRASKDNLARFEKERAQLEAQNLKRREEAERVAERVTGLSVVIIRQAGEVRQLYGSVSARDIAEAATAAGLTVDREQVLLEHPIKTLGLARVRVALHPEVSIPVDRQRRAQPGRGGAAGPRQKDRGRSGGGRGPAGGRPRSSSLARSRTAAPGLTSRVVLRLSGCSFPRQCCGMIKRPLPSVPLGQSFSAKVTTRRQLVAARDNLVSSGCGNPRAARRGP